jgi:hypothetical protein
MSQQRLRLRLQLMPSRLQW